MKKHIEYIFFALLFVVGLNSCDSTQQPTCSSFRTDKFIGTYGVSESCTNGSNGITYAVINPANSVNQNEIMFYNFNNSGLNVSAYINCADSTNGYYQIYFRIPQQNLSSTAYTVVGDGYYSETNGYQRLNFSVQYNINNQANYCDYIYTKY